MKTTRAHSARGGVILLIALAVLALFGLLALAFVLVAMHHQRTAAIAARAAQYPDNPQQTLDEALLQVLRGTDSPRSVLRPHSLLEDMYGNHPTYGAISGLTAIGDGQLSLLSAGLTVDQAAQSCGCVLTITSGPFDGESVRIVGYDSSGRLQVISTPTFPWGHDGKPGKAGVDDDSSGTIDDATETGSSGSDDLQGGASFVINGVPFGGTGFGYDPSSPASLSATFGMGPTVAPRALAPNPLAYRNSGGTYADLAEPGGADEDYDAVDYQNMLLALQTTSGSVPIPSLHRPELVRYWCTALGGATFTFGSLPARMKLATVLRPLTDFHPNFDGGNPNFDPSWDGVTGTARYDVDNDGNGKFDSVWVDLGLPVQTTSDGRLYKPLMAILCTDLDGRLNVNAHGCLAQTEANYYGPVNVTDNLQASYAYFCPPLASTAIPTPATVTGAICLPRGLGWGPAEVNLRRLFSGLTGYRTFLESRYGTDKLPGAASDDPLSQNIWSDYHIGTLGGAYWNFGTVNSGGSYGSPPNPKGSGVLPLDTTGHPIYAAMGVNEHEDDPYELNLVQRNSSDSPFTAAELERLLRSCDADPTTLPDRLYQALKNMPSTMQHSVTTDSWDLPCPSLAVAQELRNALPGKFPTHVTDLLKARGVLPQAYPYLWPTEMLAGLRMNLNRPFGDGYDGNSNNVVDDAAEQGSDFCLQVDKSGALSTSAFSYNNGVGSTMPYWSRQLYARYLYVLALTMIHYPVNPDTEDLARAKLLAQWAVNVVDFRDRDSIMTPFEYDTAPFRDDNADGNPWDVDGVIVSTSADTFAAYRGLVWGCERPELLITETLALHDRRTEDLATDSSGKKVADGDEDFDQKFRPEGSLFVELYNPNTPLEPLPAELNSGTNGTTTGGAGVDLTKTATDGTTTSPVWRLAIVDRDNASLDPNDPNSGIVYDRTVFFVNNAAATLPGDSGVQFRPSPTRQSQIAPIPPGRYALIGPDEPDQSGISYTYLSYRNDGTHGNTSTRRIMLNPNINPMLPAVGVYSDGGATADPAALGLSTQAAVPVIIDKPLRLNISTSFGGSPATGYPAADANGTAYTAASGYVLPFDIPLDSMNPMWNGTDVKLKDNGVFPRVRLIHLQRLANPLRPYHATTNPYLTVDSMPVDLHCFNGITADRDLGSAVLENPKAALIQIATRQRGETTGSTHNIWTQEPFNATGDPAASGGGISTMTLLDHYVNAPFYNTFSYLNAGFGNPRTTPAGDPSTPFPWLTWPNRPFVSPYELLLVPATSSRQLLMNPTDIDLATNPFAMSFSFGSLALPDPYTSGKTSFTHLLNFAFSTTFGGTGSSTDPPAGLARLFDFVQVPSRFVGTSVQANPTSMTGSPTYFQPPFQHIPLYREPGRVNLNTIFDPQVWEAFLNFYPDMCTDQAVRPVPMFWGAFTLSRQGFANGVAGNYPTWFANPFRSAGGASLVPPPATASVSSYALSDAVQRDVNATLMRAAPTGGRPLLQFDTTSSDPIYVTPQAGAQPILSDLNDPNRNPYFAYQVMNRLGNLVTTRSNVYAVWITVGYFEVQPIDASAAPFSSLSSDDREAIYPDGYQLGAELGAETGEIHRHRAFYLLDRSIPVGFQRGQNLNVEKTILLRRYIE